MIQAPSATAVDLLRTMKLIRRFEERCVQAYAEGQIRGFLHVYIGEEAIAAAIVPQLGAQDNVLSTYREHGHALARGVSPDAVMAELFGKREGCSGGRGGSMHIFDAAARFYGGNAIVGGGLPIAAGLALAEKLRKGERVTCCFFGEGAVAEGEFHEVMNLCALWHLPVLFVCENNLYAMGTRLDLSESVTDLRAKAAAYGMQAGSVDGMDAEAVYAAARDAIAYVRAGSGPYFLECRTYRYHGHSTADPQLYREKSEIEQWKRRDPIATLAARLKDRGEISDSQIAEQDAQIEATVARAVEFAQNGTPPDPAELMRFIYSEKPS